MSDLITAARSSAELAHNGQLRKYTGLPYITHPEAVAALVATVTASEAAIAAAWLHDVVEDCREVSHEEIYNLFGPAVGLLVYYASKKTTAKDGNKSQRLAIELRHLAEAPASAQTIKLADIIDNCSTIAERDPVFAAKYLEEKALYLEVLDRGDDRLYKRAHRIISQGFSYLRARRMQT